MMNILTGDKLELLMNHFKKILFSRPKTLIHGDIHFDNIFVDKKDPSIFTIIDW